MPEEEPLAPFARSQNSYSSLHCSYFGTVFLFLCIAHCVFLSGFNNYFDCWIRSQWGFSSILFIPGLLSRNNEESLWVGVQQKKKKKLSNSWWGQRAFLVLVVVRKTTRVLFLCFVPDLKCVEFTIIEWKKGFFFFWGIEWINSWK